MSQTTYRWDIESMERELSKLKKEYETLSESKEFLRTLAGQVEENWQSIAGDVYEGNLDVDLENYQMILNDLTVCIETLDAIIHKAYEPCESTIQAKLGAIRGSVPVL